VRDHQYTGAVGHQDHLAVDAFKLALNGFDTGVQVEFVLGQWRHAANIGQALLEQGLPVLGHVVAQAGNHEDGGGRFIVVHRFTFQ